MADGSLPICELEKVESNSSSAKQHGGRRNGAGRKPGVPNRLSGDLKAMILDALDREGGIDYLQTVARDEPKAFCSLLGRVLPMTVIGDKDNPVELTITWGKVDGGAK